MKGSKVTKLQTSMNEYYSGSESNLGKCSDYIKMIGNIEANRGLSHEKRVEREGNWLNSLKGELTYFDKSHLDGLFTMQENYVSKNQKRIKNSDKVLRDIGTLRDKLDYNPLEGFNAQEEVKESELTFYQTRKGNELGTAIEEAYSGPSQDVQTIKIKDYQPQSLVSAGSQISDKKAGSALWNSVIAVAAAATIGFTAFVGGRMYENKYQQPIIEQIINQKQEIINIQEAGITKLKNDLAEKNAEVCESKIRYENVIEETKQNMKNKVDELIKHQNDLEEKLCSAGRPDEEVRKEATKEAVHNMVEGKTYDALHETFAKTSNGFEKLKGKYNNLKQKLKAKNSKYNSLANENATSEAQLEEMTNIVDYYVNQDGYDKLNKCDGVVEDKSAIVPVVKIKKDIDLDRMINGSWNLDMAISSSISGSNVVDVNVVEDCNVCDRLEEFGITKEHYMTEPFTYGNELSDKADKHLKDGELFSWAWTGLARVGALANDIIEVPVTTVTAASGAVWGTGSNLIGNKDDGFSVGWKNGEKFGKARMDNFYGGRSKWVFDDRLLNLDLEGAINVPYCTSKTELGGHVGLSEIVWWDFVAPFINWSGSSSGNNPIQTVTGGITGEPSGTGPIGGTSGGAGGN